MHSTPQSFLTNVPFYAYWVALYPLLLLWSSNLAEVSVRQVFALGAVLIAVTTAIGFLARLLTGNWARAGLVTSLTMLIVLKYAVILKALSHLQPGGIELFRHRTLLPMLGLGVVGGGLALRRRNCERLTLWANCGALLLAVSLALIVVLRYGTLSREISQRGGFEAISASQYSVKERPNVILILLDEYARGDALRDRFGFDNSKFEAGLAQRGFTVLPDSSANYPYTILSLGSVLNMDYWPTPPNGAYSVGSKPYQVTQLLNNRVMKIFRELGYEVRTISFCSATDHMRPVDVHVGYSNLFGAVLDLIAKDSIEVAFASLFHPTWPTYVDAERGRFGDRTLQAFELLRQAEFTRPTFLFLHVLSPHRPLVFKADGSWIRREENRHDENYEKLYPQQVQFVNRSVLEAIDSVQVHSKTPPIIVVMSDHGSLSHSLSGASSMANPDQELLKERLGNFCAIRLPGHQPDPKLLKDFSAVNVFPLILNEYFQAGLPMRARRTFWMDREVPEAARTVP